MKTIEINYSMQPGAGGNPAHAAQDAEEPAAARKIEHSVAYMLRHLDKPLQVATLAALVNVSPSHYFALFKRLTGHAPIDFFIHLRMHRACELLDSTWLRVKEVAAALGYEDPFYFSRVFKSVNRVAPSQYRALPQEFRDVVKKMTLTFSDPAFKTHQVTQIQLTDSIRFTALLQPGQKTTPPVTQASKPEEDRDWKERTLRSTPKALCYAG